MRLRTQLTLSFIAIVLFVGVSSALFGRYFIATQVVKEAERRVRADLLVASDVYHDRLRELQILVDYLAQDRTNKESLNTIDRGLVARSLVFTRKREGLDVLMILDKKGTVFFRANNPLRYGDLMLDDPLVKRGIAGESYSALQILSAQELGREGSIFVRRAIGKTGNSFQGHNLYEDTGSGMMMRAVAPMRDDRGKIKGVVLGGIMLNGNIGIIDMMVKLVFRGEKYGGREVGIASLFQGGIRIATNIQDKDGSRAVGTRIEPEVYEDVLQRGKLWLKRAWSVNAWYLTAYEPIKDIHDNIIGALGVGIIEGKYQSMENQVARIFLGLTIGGIVIALMISYILTRNLTDPIKDLVKIAERVEQGDYEADIVDVKIQRRGSEEIIRLMDSFSAMVQKILRQKMRLENIIQTMGEGIFVFDREGKITIFNQAAEEITGFKNTEVTGRNFSEVFEGIYCLMGDMKFDPAQNRGRKTIRETTLISKEGKEIPVSIDIELIRGEEGEAFGGVVIFRDISEEKALEQLKKDFVSAVTHDLKNPLVPILGFSSRILQGKLGIVDKRITEAVQIIHNSGEKIFNLIENFLSASRIESGKLELECDAVSIHEVIGKIHPLIDFQRADRDLEFEISVPDDLPLVHVDKAQIERVLTNLVWNAIKFTPASGKIMVRATKEERFVRVDVEDTGIGIPEEYVPIIFDRYKKMKRTAARGAGLGLYIAKSIIEAHGGKIWVESCPNRGSCFSFTIPVKP
jgi:PAS domain S-box-containing protein